MTIFLTKLPSLHFGEAAINIQLINFISPVSLSFLLFKQFKKKIYVKEKSFLFNNSIQGFLIYCRLCIYFQRARYIAAADMCNHVTSCTPEISLGSAHVLYIYPKLTTQFSLRNNCCSRMDGFSFPLLIIILSS